MSSTISTAAPILRTLLTLTMVALALAPGAARADDETQTYPFVLPYDHVDFVIGGADIGVGSVGCQSPTYDEFIPVTARYCLAIPAGAKTVDVRVENLSTGTDADATIGSVAVDYGTNYYPGPRGGFCGTATITLHAEIGSQPVLILEPRGLQRGLALCGGEPLRPGVAIAGQIVATFHR